LKALAYIENMLNDRPRKILGFRTPREVYNELIDEAQAEKARHSSTGVAFQA
jgi:hypothetical protein